MVWLILLAAWGLLCLGWVILGWVLPKASMTTIFRCPPNRHPDGAIARHRWLRDLGMIQGSLVVLGDISPTEQAIWKQKYTHVDFLTPEVIASVPELERTI